MLDLMWPILLVMLRVQPTTVGVSMDFIWFEVTTLKGIIRYNQIATVAVESQWTCRWTMRVHCIIRPYLEHKPNKKKVKVTKLASNNQVHALVMPNFRLMDLLNQIMLVYRFIVTFSLFSITKNIKLPKLDLEFDYTK